MDMQMPEMDGVEATRLIRSNGEIHQPYILALTANAMSEDRERCLAVGMNDFLAKQIKLNELARCLELGVQQHLDSEPQAGTAAGQRLAAISQRAVETGLQ
jgi:CheY-like chemotaxis protein